MSVDEILQALYHLQKFMDRMPKRYAIKFLARIIHEIEKGE